MKSERIGVRIDQSGMTESYSRGWEFNSRYYGLHCMFCGRPTGVGRTNFAWSGYDREEDLCHSTCCDLYRLADTQTSTLNTDALLMTY